MLILLPPSETKRDGGEPGSAFSTAALAFPELSAARATVLDATVALSADPEAARVALKLGPKQVSEVARNAVLHSAPTLPAIDRYDGVLYDALDASTLTDPQRRFAHKHVAIASALFGVTRALDPLPAYRLSADSRLPELSLKKLWSSAVSSALAAHTGLLLDMRSEAYAALGPLPHRDDAVFVRVVSDEGGRKRALNHFNKAGKGRLARAIVEAGEVHADAEQLCAWAATVGIRLEPGVPGELDLVV